MPTALSLVLLAGLSFVGCGEDEVVEKVVFVERSGCLGCHRPIDEEGVAHGIEQAHPDVEGGPLTCVECHGGNPDARAQSEAHVKPLSGGVGYVRNLSAGELDDVDRDYLRFVNPGEYRVAKRGCGSGSPRAGEGSCHQDLVDTVLTNPMATFSGELGVGRYRAGMQRTGAATKGIYDVSDPNYRLGQVPATVGRLEQLVEPRIEAGEDQIGPYQDLYFTKACMRCHTWSFGDNKFPGDFRSSGCTACHMIYGNDGLSESDDPVIKKTTPPHPRKHRLTKAVTTEQCTHCHYRGGRIGPSYQGYRESAAAGYNPDHPGSLGQPLHGHDADYYITDEDTTNDYDETPADVHFEAGMHCIDCHTSADVHGDGRIYADSTNAVEITCESCHGDNNALATMRTRGRTEGDAGRPLNNVELDAEGVYWLTGKVDGVKRRIPQVKTGVERAGSGTASHQLMGRDDNGFSHMDNIACDTCHSAWIPTCFGCHVSVDMRKQQRSLVAGRTTPGKVIGGRKWVETDVMMLMLDTQGKIRLSQPAERMFFTVTNGAGEKVIDKRVRRGPRGEIGHGQRAFAPHTTQRSSPFMQCTRCHPADAEFSNMAQVMQAVGQGSNDFLEEDGDGRTWALDRYVSESPDHEVGSFWPFETMDERTLEVLVGHDQPQKSGPLAPETIRRMLDVIISEVR